MDNPKKQKRRKLNKHPLNAAHYILSILIECMEQDLMTKCDNRYMIRQSHLLMILQHNGFSINDQYLSELILELKDRGIINYFAGMITMQKQTKMELNDLINDDWNGAVVVVKYEELEGILKGQDMQILNVKDLIVEIIPTDNNSNGLILSTLKLLDQYRHLLQNLKWLRLGQYGMEQSTGKYGLRTNANQSLEICKLITKFMSGRKQNDNVEIMELCCVALNQRELDYLRFWFHDSRFGKVFIRDITNIQKDWFLVHIRCENL